MPVIIRDCIAGNLVDPALQFFFVAQGINASVYLQKNVLQDIFAALFVGYTPEHELFEFWVKFFPDFFRGHGHRGNHPFLALRLSFPYFTLRVATYFPFCRSPGKKRRMWYYFL